MWSNCRSTFYCQGSQTEKILRQYELTRRFLASQSVVLSVWDSLHCALNSEILLVHPIGSNSVVLTFAGFTNQSAAAPDYSEKPLYCLL